MNPIAILAFIAGITTTPTAPPSQEQQPPQVKEQSGNTQQPQGALKCDRGGWDRN